MTVAAGDQIQCPTGTWDGTPTSYTYQWGISTDNVSWSNIGGETRSDYITTTGDIDSYVRCCVVATNLSGSTSTICSVGELVAVFVPPADIGGTPAVVPVISVDPVVSGTATVGSTISSTSGTWTNSPTSYAYQWQSSANGLTGWSSTGSTSTSLLLTGAHEDLYLRCRVIASNGDGPSIAAYSNALGPIEGIPDVPTGSRRKDRRTKGGTRPSGRIRRTVS